MGCLGLDILQLSVLRISSQGQTPAVPTYLPGIIQELNVSGILIREKKGCTALFEVGLERLQEVI